MSTHRLRNWNSLNHRLNMSRLIVTFCQWINISCNFQLNRISQRIGAFRCYIHCKQLLIHSITIQSNALIDQTHSILHAYGIWKNIVHPHQQQYNRFPYIPLDTFLFRLFSFHILSFLFTALHCNVVILWLIQMKLYFINIFIQFKLYAQLELGAHLYFMCVAPSHLHQMSKIWNFHK